MSLSAKRTSKVWHYFHERVGENKAQCLICNEIFVFRGHSSNLYKHLKRMHRLEAISLGVDVGPEPTVKPKIEKGTKGAVGIFSTQAVKKVEFPNQSICLPLPGKSPSRKIHVIEKAQSFNAEKKRLLDEKVVAMIALDLQPISIVENKGFVDLIKCAESAYTLPSHDRILNELLPNLYNSTAELLKKKLEGIHKIALTTDLWCTGNQADYLTLSVHYISENDWNSHSLTLSTSVFYGTYTGDDVANEIERNVACWNLTDKVKMMITDSATNMLLASQNLPWGIIPCLAHLIHLVVSDAISEDLEVSSLIQRVQEVVNFFYFNVEAMDRLTETQRSLNLPERKLVQGVIVRWNSIFYMFERLIEQLDAVNAVLSNMGKEDKCLSCDDREMMTRTLTSLKPFEIVAKTLSLDKGNFINIGMAMPLMEGLQKMMNSLKDEDVIMEPFTTSLKAGLIKRFEQMWNSEWIVSATLLDPRYKKFPFANKALQQKAIENIVGEVSIIMEIMRTGLGGVADANDDANNAMAESEEDALWNYLDGGNVEPVQETKALIPISAAYREVHRYLDSSPISRKECPLIFWRHHSEMLPNLSQVALKYMGVPATCTSSDKFFSKAGELLVERKSRLQPQTLDMVLFLNRNLP